MNNSKRTILVTGANGQLGSEIRELAAQFSDFDFLFTDLPELDITNETDVTSYFRKNKPDVIVNCAAYTAVDKAESEPEPAFRINAEAPAILAAQAAATGALLVHVSTDYVFDGTGSRPYLESDPTNPASVYGKSKLAGEEAVRTSGGNAIIIRTSWLYSAFGNNFVKTIMKRGTEQGWLRVVDDQFGSPTYARDLANAILSLIPKAKANSGIEIFHYANAGIISWFDFAKAIVEIAGIHCDTTPVKTGEFPVVAPRPMYSVMDSNKFCRQFNIQIPEWHSSLKHCIDRLQANSQ